ncbi:hypothetical protein A7P95_06610 [Eikenella longinqua]|uniref:Nitrogen fixation protein FixH n=1 Tax=Eikenella longinqua TaxID=1795827 RepID=A0A1A9RWW9_9NEIS|nr:FixH family protein [Eikenella longinqua]OAM27581.1 hypothetical protein A7P95_06610 [Eikenella longinqua]
MSNHRPPRPGSTPAKPWYKHPWPWLLMAGPAIVVVAGFYTYYLAAHRNNPSLVTDDYYREGKNIALQMERDEKAERRQIRADVLVSPDNSRAKILLSGQINPDTPLKLVWLHPARDQYDQTVEMQRQGSAASAANRVEYAAVFQPLRPTDHWYVRVEDGSGKWRVQGVWHPQNGHSLSLIPQRQPVAPNPPAAEK